MDEVIVVFDKIPTKQDGGLVATYVDFVNELSDVYQISFLSIFKSPETDIDEFRQLEIKTLFPWNIDNYFHRAPDYLRRGKFKAFAWALVSAVLFFCCIPIARIKTNSLLQAKRVVAVAPAAAMFLGKRVRFLLEIHIDFEYFWGDNLLGRAQSALIPPAQRTVFRNAIDAAKGSRLFPSTYIYNTFGGSSGVVVELPEKLAHRALFVGRLVDQKNPLMLLECAEKVRVVLPDFKLDIYGDGPLRIKLEEEIELRGLESCVRLCGFTTDKTVYRNYDLLWLTSRYEGFGLVIIEAAASMTPTVSTRWGEAVSEIIRDGETGYVVDSVDEFVEKSISLMASLDLRCEVGRNAYQDFLDRFSPEKHRQRWIDLFNETYGEVEVGHK